ncbi:TPA: hypothetical protein GXZ34_02605 [bacterium]|nr:hypothetical protein [bacterium]
MFYYDQKTLVIGNFKKIQSISDTLMEFLFANFRLQVEGTGLSLPYLEDAEVGVRGNITAIKMIYTKGEKNA